MALENFSIPNSSPRLCLKVLKHDSRIDICQHVSDHEIDVISEKEQFHRNCISFDCANTEFTGLRQRCTHYIAASCFY